VVYPIGDRAPMAGLPMVNPLRWDTGVEVKFGNDPVELGVAVTQGTISNPRVRDDNSGKQVAARVGVRPAFGWVLGVSGARGEYVADDVTSVTGDTGYQTAFGLDLEFSRNHVVVRAETIWSQWDAPTLQTGALGAVGFYVEASYKVSPGFYVAARIDRVSFDEVDSAVGAVTWDSTISRIEIGAGYYFHRRLLVKASYQYNERDAGPLTTRGIPSVQLLFWF
jgi:predicted porin